MNVFIDAHPEVRDQASWPTNNGPHHALRADSLLSYCNLREKPDGILAAGAKILQIFFEQVQGAVSERPLSLGPRPSRNGTAFSAHFSGAGYDAASSPKQLWSISVLMMPGLSGTAHIPGGSS